MPNDLHDSILCISIVTMRRLGYVFVSKEQKLTDTCIPDLVFRNKHGLVTIEAQSNGKVKPESQVGNSPMLTIDLQPYRGEMPISAILRQLEWDIGAQFEQLKLYQGRRKFLKGEFWRVHKAKLRKHKAEEVKVWKDRKKRERKQAEDMRGDGE